MNEKNMRFRVGLFVLGTLVLLAVLTFMFSGFPTFFKSHQAYTILFREAAGVGPGTPVRRSGVRIGEVRNVELDDATGNVRVGIFVEGRHPLHRDDEPTLARSLLGGDISIDFVPRRTAGQPADTTPIDPGSELTGTQRPDALSLLNQTSGLVPTTQETLSDMRKSMQRYEQMAPQLEDAVREYKELAKAARETVPDLRRTNDEILVTARNWGRLGERMDLLVQTNQDKLIQAVDNLNDSLRRVSQVFNEENQRNLATTLKNARAGSENLESLSKNTDELIKESRQTVRKINSTVAQADEVFHNLQQVTKPMAERGSSVMKNLDESTDKLNKTLTEARELLRAVSQSDGTLHRFVADPALYNNITDASCMLVRLLPRLDRILHDMEVFTDKIARHPESLGLGGVVSPSSGLKDAPSSSPPWRH